MTSRNFTRDALRKAMEGLEPDTGALVASVPALMAEAGRRRRQAEAGPSLVTLAWRAVPRFAAVALVVGAATFALVVWDRASAGDGRDAASLEAALANGSGDEDALIEAVLPPERN